MAKTLFYAGVIFCALFAATSVSYLVRQTELEAVLLSPLDGTLRTGYRLVIVLAMSIPVAALFIRMASLVAARNLFAALFATFAVAGAGVSLGVLAMVQLRGLIGVRSETIPSAVSSAEMRIAALYVFGWFLSVALFSLRPYFRIQASRTLSILVSLPLPIFSWFLLARLHVAPRSLASSVFAASLSFWALIATLFLAISVHCLRHRHLFIEVTNLRELLDRRVDPADSPRRRITFSGGGVAFDS